MASAALPCPTSPCLLATQKAGYRTSLGITLNKILCSACAPAYALNAELGTLEVTVVRHRLLSQLAIHVGIKGDRHDGERHDRDDKKKDDEGMGCNE